MPTRRDLRKLIVPWLLLAGLGTFSATAASSAADTKIVGWRTNGLGLYPDASPPTKWTSEDIAWSTKLPDQSNASPVVLKDRIFVCAEPDTLICVNRDDGKILWQRKNGAGRKDRPRTTDDNGYSSSTPITDGKRVGVVFGNGVAAVYTMVGEKLWKRYIENPRNYNGWGHSASPLLIDNKLILHLKNLIAVDFNSGKEVWRTDTPTSWGTPAAGRVGETKIIVTPQGDIVRVKDGAILKSALFSMFYSSPVMQGDVVYAVDINIGAKAIRLSAAKGDTVTAKELWSAKPKKDRYYASPILHKGLLYAVTQGGMLAVIDGKTGGIVYQKQIYFRRRVYSSISLAGEYIFLHHDSGKTVVIKPGRSFTEVSRPRLRALRSTPVFFGKNIYVRALDGLYCIANK